MKTLTQKYLFIGGPVDGTERDVDAGQFFAEIGFNSGPDIYESVAYTRRTAWLGRGGRNGSWYYFAHESLSNEEAHKKWMEAKT